MKYELPPCIDNDAEFIEKKADEVFDSMAPAEEGAEEEVYFSKSQMKIISSSAVSFWSSMNVRLR